MQIRKSRIWQPLLKLVLVGILVAPVYPVNAEIKIPKAESNLFILDVSGSTYSEKLWESLKSSVQEKLKQPFGNPMKTKGIPPRKPMDVSITSITDNSQNSPIFNIVTLNDSKEVWGVIDLTFKNAGPEKLLSVYESIFKEGGAWSAQAKVFDADKVVPPIFQSCLTSMNLSFSKDSYARNLDKSKTNAISTVLCNKLVQIAQKYKSADDYFSNPICKKGNRCSDVAGAIFRATALAVDVKKRTSIYDDTKPRLCIAIASDMLHSTDTMLKNSSLNSRYLAQTEKTLDSAFERGKEAAALIGVKFPEGITTRVDLIGVGSGPKPLPLERNSFLLKYWEGFFLESGIKVAAQSKSLDKACS